jgi:ATP dependent DNA ligase domain
VLQRTLPAGFIAPCLPTKTTQLPSGGQWLHEIKHDGFRVIARKDGARARLYSRPGNDLSRRFPLIVETLARLRSRSCIIDGEAVACDDNGIASFDLVRHHRANDGVFLHAFDLIELNGYDLRRDPLEAQLFLGPWLAAGAPRQAYRKHRALARLARHGHIAAHHTRELAGNGEAKPSAAELLRGGDIDLAELLE